MTYDEMIAGDKAQLYPGEAQPVQAAVPPTVYAEGGSVGGDYMGTARIAPVNAIPSGKNTIHDKLAPIVRANGPFKSFQEYQSVARAELVKLAREHGHDPQDPAVQKKIEEDLDGPLAAKAGRYVVDAKAAGGRYKIDDRGVFDTFAGKFLPETGKVVKRRLVGFSSDGKGIFEDQNGNVAVESIPDVSGPIKPKVEPNKRESGNMVVGSDAEGNPLVMNTRGDPNIRAVTVAGGGPVFPKAKNLSDEAAKNFAGFAIIREPLADVEKYYDPKFVGMVDSRVGAAEQATGIGASENQGKFRASLNSVQNQLVYLRSGAQINENEFQRLKSELPVLETSETDFMARLANFKKQLDAIERERTEMMKRGGVRLRDKSAASAAAPTASGNEPISVISPDGKPGTIPASFKDAALKQGYRLK
jgi:hypothetical protein